jgi:dethiobiotin synthetase
MLVSRHYLGSINHTLLSLEVLKQRGISVAGILFNGEEHPATESIIAELTGVMVLGRIPVFTELSVDAVSVAADQLRERLLQAL